MPFLTYDIAVPTAQRALTNLRAVLQKGEAHATDKGYAPAQYNLALLHSRQAAGAHASDWLVLGGAVTLFVAGLVVPPLLCGWLVIHLLQGRS